MVVLSPAFTFTDGVPVTGSLKARKNDLPSLSFAFVITGFSVSTVTTQGFEVTLFTVAVIWAMPSPAAVTIPSFTAATFSLSEVQVIVWLSNKLPSLSFAVAVRTMVFLPFSMLSSASAELKSTSVTVESSGVFGVEVGSCGLSGFAVSPGSGVSSGPGVLSGSAVFPGSSVLLGVSVTSACGGSVGIVVYMISGV